MVNAECGMKDEEPQITLKGRDPAGSDVFQSVVGLRQSAIDNAPSLQASSREPQAPSPGEL
jgi:hypothetical protein